MAETQITEMDGGSPQKRFGYFSGVFTPSILTILGVIMYMRFGWVVGSLGLVGAIVVVVVSHLISLSTGLSVASIATNRTVGAGGAYFMISRSLGAPSGAAIGIPLFLGQALSFTFYVVGFVESIAILYPNVDVRIGGTIVCVLMTLISYKGAEYAIRIQYFIMGAIFLSLLSILFGAPPDAPTEPTLYNYRGADFATVFAVFFPAVTGIMAGVGMSGDLRDPRTAIPKGTLLAVLVGFVIYLILPVWLAYNASSDTLVNDKNFLFHAAAIPALVYIGVWGATLSSALGSILTAPRTLQALAADGLAPKIFAKGSGPANEPRIGMLFTFVLAEAGVLLGSLDAIAPILTMFFLATYGFTNLACALERFAANPSFRPTFTVSMWVSLLGAVSCFYVMSIIDFPAMLAATAFCFLIYFIVQRRAMGMTYGDARHGIWAALVRASLQRLQRAEYHPINWRPNLIILGGNPDKRDYLLELGSAVVQDRGLVTYFHLLEGLVSNKAARRVELVDELRSRFEREHPNVFYRADVVDDVYRGGVNVAQSYGLGTFEPNTLMLGWPTRTERPEGYVQMLRDLVSLDKSVLAVHYNLERGYGDRKEIHIWWGGFKGNGGMMLLLAYLVTAQRKWKKAKVTLLTVVEAESDREDREEVLQHILENARLEATSRVLVRKGRAIGDLMEEESGDADLLILGMRIPDTDESAVGFIRQKQQLLEKLPTSVLVQSARHFVGEPVLFDTNSAEADQVGAEISPER